MGTIIIDGSLAVAGSPFEPITWRQLITDALVEIGSYGAGESPDNAHIELGRRCLNEILDSWQARESFAYNSTFTTYTLTAAHQPHLLGPGLTAPDWSTTVKPNRIGSASIVFTDGTESPLNIRDSDWWASQTSKVTTSSIPSDLYYNNTLSYGSIYLWGVPTVAYGLRLQCLVAVNQVPTADLGTDFIVPVGYYRAIKLTLAEAIRRPMGKAFDPVLAKEANDARCVIQEMNIKSPRATSMGYGGGRGTRYDILTGMNR